MQTLSHKLVPSSFYSLIPTAPNSEVI